MMRCRGAIADGVLEINQACALIGGCFPITTPDCGCPPVREGKSMPEDCRAGCATVVSTPTWVRLAFEGSDLQIISKRVLAIILSLCASVVHAQIFGPGDLAITGWNSDANDDIAFVLLTDGSSLQTVTLTDNEWDGAAFTAGEGELQWTVPAGGLAAGTVVVISDLSTTPTANVGAVVSINTINFANENEGLFAILGTVNAPTAFLAGLSSNDVGGFGTLTGTGLIEGVTAIDLEPVDANLDIGEYVGLRQGAKTFSDYLVFINDPANWITEDGGGDQSGPPGPSVPFDTTPFTLAPPELSFQSGFEKSESPRGGTAHSAR